jgi:hypothetical protein
MARILSHGPASVSHIQTLIGGFAAYTPTAVLHLSLPNMV